MTCLITVSLTGLLTYGIVCQIMLSLLSANTTNVFENRLPVDKFWHDHEFIYDFKAQLEGMGSRSGVEG